MGKSRHYKREAPWLTPEILAIPRIQAGPKAFFPVCLTTGQPCTPESLHSAIHVESVLLVSEVLLQKVTTGGSNVDPFLVFAPKTVGEIN